MPWNGALIALVFSYLNGIAPEKKSDFKNCPDEMIQVNLKDKKKMLNTV